MSTTYVEYMESLRTKVVLPSGVLFRGFHVPDRLISRNGKEVWDCCGVPVRVPAMKKVSDRSVRNREFLDAMASMVDV